MKFDIFEIIFLAIPICSGLAATIFKITRKKFFEAFLLLCIVFVVTADGIASFRQLDSDFIPAWVNAVQLYMGVLMLPMAFTYFAIQVGSGWRNAYIYWSYLVALLVVFPNIIIFAGTPQIPEGLDIKASSITIIRDGIQTFRCDITDIVALLQLVIILARIIIFSRSLHKLEIMFSKQLKTFFLLAVGCVLFAVATFVIPWDFWQEHRFLFMGGFAFFIAAEFLQLCINGDISALVTKEDNEPVLLNEYIKMNSELAERARLILEGEKRYLLPGIVIDDMVNELGTNRTYFTRMMRIEFGQSFSEYVNNKRLEYSQNLLKNSDKSIIEIAEESGFGSASTFYRVFKRLTDTTPEAWRESHQIK